MSDYIKFRAEEMETYIMRTYGSQEWVIFTNNPYDMKKFKGRNYPVIKEKYYPDGTPESMEFVIPKSCIAFRNHVELSEEEKEKRRQSGIALHQKYVDSKKGNAEV